MTSRKTNCKNNRRGNKAMKELTTEFLKENIRKCRMAEHISNDLIDATNSDVKISPMLKTATLEMHRENLMKARGAAENTAKILSEITGVDVLEIDKELFDVCPECHGVNYSPTADGHYHACKYCHGAGLDYTSVKNTK
jgi:hypothetical protein